MFSVCTCSPKRWDHCVGGATPQKCYAGFPCSGLAAWPLRRPKGLEQSKCKASAMKRIVTCSDGTWQTPVQANTTRVIEMARAVLPTTPDAAVKVVFYGWGVGTESRANRLAGGISGKGIERNIRDCYRFLVHNYDDGDGIYLFGFSRGAYTVRSLAALIRNCGVLRKAEAGRLSEAYRMYCRNGAVLDS